MPKLPAAGAALRGHSPTGERRVHGALNFFVDPKCSAKEQPAIWRADANPSIVIMNDADREWLPCAHLIGAGAVLAEQETNSGRHLVVEVGGHRHRLLLTRSPAASGYLIPSDTMVNIRLAATEAFHSLASDGRTRYRARLEPSPYQRHRLALLLALLDQLDGQRLEPPTLRKIAQQVVFPGLGIGTAMEWKTSSHRRQVQRLLAEARRTASIGFRDLLLHQAGRGAVGTGKPTSSEMIA